MAAQLSQGNAPGEDLRAQQSILEDIFMHAAAHSRRCDSISERVQSLLRRREGALTDRTSLDADEVVELSDAIGYLQMAVRDVCAKIAPAAVDRARMLANINPDPDQQVIFDLEVERLDNFMRPIFAEAGLFSDYLTDAELKATRRWSEGSTPGGTRGAPDRSRRST